MFNILIDIKIISSAYTSVAAWELFHACTNEFLLYNFPIEIVFLSKEALRAFPSQ